MLYNVDGFDFSTIFGHMMFQECDVWVLNLFYLLLHVLIILLLYTLVIFFLLLIIIIIVMRFIHEPPGNPIPRYDANKVIDLFFFLSIELLHRIFSWFVLSNQSLSMHHDTAKYPQEKLCPQIKEILLTIICYVIDYSGNFGNTIDGQALPGEVVDEVRRNGENPFIHPLTPPVKPVTNDRQYYHIPWEDSKPCTHIKFTWQDHRRRLYNSNVLLKICERLVGSLFQSFN